MMKLTRTDKIALKEAKKWAAIHKEEEERILRGRARIDSAVNRLSTAVCRACMMNPHATYHVYVAQPIDGEIREAPIVHTENPDVLVYADIGILHHHTLIADISTELWQILYAGWRVFF